RELAQNAAAHFPPGQLTIHGIVSLRLARLAGRERAQFLIESPARAPLQTFLARWLPHIHRLRLPARLRWHIDVDPQEI
ncbi:MAG: primosomal protein N', partial [Rhodocyclaceae bacterium]|nr:primosomal protein N' [Rhodocyclaceae bacterium]